MDQNSWRWRTISSWNAVFVVVLFLFFTVLVNPLAATHFSPLFFSSLGTDRTVLPHVIDRALLFLVPLCYFIRPPIDSLESVH